MMIDLEILYEILSGAKTEHKNSLEASSVIDGVWKEVLEYSEPERKKGKWQLCGNHHLCSECDEWALTVWDDNEYEEVDVLTNFCHNCGADMRGEQE